MFETDAFDKIVESGPEVVVYMMIEEIGGFTWLMSHDMAHGRIPSEHHSGIDADIEKSREQQKALVQCTSRFGFEPFDEKDSPTEDYWLWYRWWNRWHKDMPEEEWRKIDGILGLDMTQEQVSLCRPSGNWRPCGVAEVVDCN